jgi:Tol biopolymer transport system component
VRGTMLVEGAIPNGATLPEMFLIALDGTGKHLLGIGSWGALSLDSLKAAFSFTDGLHLLDLISGKSERILWAGENPYHPIFSPDGKQLAWSSGGTDPGVYVADLTGGSRHKVAGTNAFTSLAGWMPDNLRIVITQIGPKGSQVRLINIQTGYAEDLFVINNAKGGFPALSPDGKRIAYSEAVFGAMSYTVFVSHLDGSDKRPVAAFDQGITAQATTWSPDGGWLVLTLGTYLSPTVMVQTPILLRPETCDSIALPFEGKVVGWAW